MYDLCVLQIDGGSLSNYRGLNGDTPADSVSVRSDANMSLSSLEELASGLMRKVLHTSLRIHSQTFNLIEQRDGKPLIFALRFGSMAYNVNSNKGCYLHS